MEFLRSSLDSLDSPVVSCVMGNKFKRTILEILEHRRDYWGPAPEFSIQRYQALADPQGPDPEMEEIVKLIRATNGSQFGILSTLE